MPRTKPEILSVSTLQVLDNAARLGVLPQAEAEILRSAARLYHDLTQILRLCVTGKFNPETAGENLLRVMARAGDTPDFSTLEARVRETQAEVRRVFQALVGGARYERLASSCCPCFDTLGVARPSMRLFVSASTSPSPRVSGSTTSVQHCP